jgi:hypothetical protein
MRSCLPSGRITCRTRLPFEHHVFTVVAAVTLVRPEDDSDLHLVLQERGYDMIAEAPAPYCDRQAKPIPTGRWQSRGAMSGSALGRE